ncbi:MAG: PAS domain-containing protein [Scytolyngbya sp. HA4215-MV1]|jgi:two-component system CheB/CheR fusion protein|nr:PAS domain-containing protein [Scytolyngbya sp. HA4215-MV1]
MSTDDDDRIFAALLDYLQQSRGFDFSGYKRSSLQRRIRKQMQSHAIESFGDYLDYLEVHPEEFEVLLNTILINVTAFFRDTAAWDDLQTQILPSLLSQKAPNATIRVWSAGCAAGEEAYTLAIVLTELLGAIQFRQQVKIYATDVDEEALAQARSASYTAKAIATIPATLQQKYFDLIGDRFVFRADLRRAVIFGRHDLMQDAPISRLDLLVCRNTLMYFNADAQKRILARLHFALNPNGLLFLGKAEMLLTHTNLFTPRHLAHRIFMKVPKIDLRDRLLVLAQTGDEEAGDRLSVHIKLRDVALNAVPIAQLVVDSGGNLVIANQAARSLFGISLQNLGRPLQDLEISYRPIELRSRIEQVYSDRHLVVIPGVVRHLPDGSVQYLDVQLTPLQEEGEDLLGVAITFTDVTRYHILQTEVQRANQDLETANEELQSSNEELETTNEELQSTNEELETTNEELQSTNEELETMNEELQSTNEELQTINDELRQRTQELNQVNAFLESILASIQAGVVVLDPQFSILSWNNEAENLWGVRADEVRGQSFFSLDIGLPVSELGEVIRMCIAGIDYPERVVTATNRRGRQFGCRVTCNPLLGLEKERQGAILVMEEVEKI